MRSTRGVALVELLAIMAVPSAVAFGSSLDTTRTPVSRFSTDPAPSWVAAAMRGLEGCADFMADNKQPMVVYASASTFSFETDCLADDSDDKLVRYMGPNASEDVVATPDTITFSFQPDPTTARPDDFVMMRRVNGRRPEAIVRNVLPYPGQPFFQYFYRGAQENALSSRGTALVPNNWLPLQHPATKHGTAADSGAASRIDALVALEMNYTVTNGRTGRAQRTEHVHNIVAFASLNRNKKRLCEEDQLLRQASLMQTNQGLATTGIYLTSSGFTTALPRSHACAS